MTSAEPIVEPVVEPVAPVAPAVEPQPTSWMDGAALSTDMKANPTIQKYQSAEALARGHVELQSTFGQDKVVWPGKDAEAQEFDPIYSKLGRPETVEGYELSDFKPPEGVPFHGPEVLAKMAERMHGRRLTKEQAQGMFADYAEIQAEQHAATQAQAQQANIETRNALEAEWGAAAPVKMEQAKKAALAFVEKAGLEENPFDSIVLPNGTLLGDHPSMLKLMALIGDEFGEDAGPGPGIGKRMTKTPEEANNRIAAMHADAEVNKALFDGGHPLHRQYTDEMASLMQQKHPE